LENTLTVAQLGRREQKKLAVRERICLETAGLIERHGIDGTTIDAICDCAEIAKKTFYNYYSAKHDLLNDICKNTLLNRTETLVNEALASSNVLAEQLDHIIHVMIQRNRDAGRLERELIDYMVSNLSEHRSQGAGQLTFMNNCFLRLYTCGQAQLKPSLTPAFCAEITVGMINAITLNWLHNDNHDTEQKFAMLLSYIKDSMIAETSGN
jgi:AcrR family transcriptional regulator